jgi:hypothetical protein
MSTFIELGTGAAVVGGALDNLFNLVKTLAAIDDRIKRNEIVLEIQDELLKYQSAYLAEIEQREAAVKRADTLEKKLLETEDFARNAQFYESLSPCDGITVYRHSQAPKEGGKRNWYCPCCFEKKKLRLLQAAAELNPRGEASFDIGFKCNECGFSFFMLRRVARDLIG